MFSPMIMPNDAYEELCHTYAMTLPIPKPGDALSRTDLYYMAFEEAVKEAFTDIPFIERSETGEQLSDRWTGCD